MFMVFREEKGPSCFLLRNNCGETVIPLDWASGDHDSHPRSVPIHCATSGKTLLSLGFPIWILRGLDRSLIPKTHHLKCL